MKCIILRVGGSWPHEKGLGTAKLDQFYQWQPEILIGLMAHSATLIMSLGKAST